MCIVSMRVCLYLNQRVRSMEIVNGIFFRIVSKTKKRKKNKTNEEIESHNSIQD